MTVRYLVGDSLAITRTLPDASVDLVATSPPFLCLRNYNDLDGQIGSEANPAEFLDVLLDLAVEWRRVLAPHGSIAVELGDTYCGARGYGKEGSLNPAYGGGKQEGHFEYRTAKRFKRKDDGWPLAKSLCGVPTLFAWSLAYGHNLLNPAHTLEPWRVRNLIVWARNNPPAGALGDKVRPATSYITVATPSPRRWFDLDSVRSGSPGAAGSAIASVAQPHVVIPTPEAGDEAALRGWCNPGDSKVGVGAAMAWQAQRLQIVEPVGFKVGVEQLIGAKVMDLQSPVALTDAASVAVAVESLLSGRVPVSASVAGSPAVPSGIVLASDVHAPPLSGALEAAKVVSTDLALVPGKWLAARVTLDFDGTSATAYAVAPLTCGELSSWHSEQSTSNHGAPPTDHWTDEYDGDLTWLVNTAGSKLSHYAMWPAKLAERLVLSMCPAEVCTTCGKPRERLTGPVEYVDRAGKSPASEWQTGDNGVRAMKKPVDNGGMMRVAPTLGWSDCGHGTYRSGVTLDPFAGTSTTLCVAEIHGRDSIGIDLDPANRELMPKRMAEVKRALLGVKDENVEGQMDLFGGAA